MFLRPVGAGLQSRIWSRHSPGGATDFSLGIHPQVIECTMASSPNGATDETITVFKLHKLAAEPEDSGMMRDARFSGNRIDAKD